MDSYFVEGMSGCLHHRLDEIMVGDNISLILQFLEDVFELLFWRHFEEKHHSQIAEHLSDWTQTGTGLQNDRRGGVHPGPLDRKGTTVQ